MDHYRWWLIVVLAVGAATAAGAAEDASTVLRSQADPGLDYPIRVVEAEPYWRPAEDKGLTTREGLFHAEHRPLGTLAAERVRLPTPKATWKLTGRVGRLNDGTIVAGFGAYLYWSRDEGRSWTGRWIGNLPDTDGPVNLRAFGVGGDQLLLAHDLTALGQLDVPDREAYPVGISRSSDLGETWIGSGPLKVPAPYTFLAGDGNHIVSLPDGTLIAALDAANHRVETFQVGWLAQVFFRSRDGGESWGDLSLLRDRAAEVGLLPLGGQRLLAACRGMSNPVLGGKTIQLRRSDDGARTWSDGQQLSWVFGQAHADLARLSGNSIVAVYENRYPVGRPDIRARISHDLGKTWEPTLYLLADGVGYAGSIGLEDGTIVTVTGDGQTEGGRPTGRGYTLQAVRWKPTSPHPGPQSPESARFDPVVQKIEGWTVHVDPSLLEGAHREEGARALRMLGNHLQRIALLMPEDRLRRVHGLEIWIEHHHPTLGAMQYHPNLDWLTSRGYDPRLAKKVHIPRAKALLSRHQLIKHPMVVLHELAHAYHDQHLGFDDPRVVEVYEKAKAGGSYDEVLLYTGKRVRHYGLTDHKEYLAEGTEAYFYRNDFYPFVRAELKEHDPALHDLLVEIWGPLE